MQCDCGGITETRTATYRGTDLDYERCKGCGRCGQWLLLRNGELLASGIEAQRRFNVIKAKRAEVA